MPLPFWCPLLLLLSVCIVLLVAVFSWDSKVEYLFLRLNYPDVSKLRPHLTNSSAAAAYCCQCSWKGVTDSIRVPDGLKWVCTGAHS